ncbi:DNA-processing protein DprA [Marinomonas pollencensis]|uniref:DNA processing protein n=1 Tax=Marinomonas pollencensis TaxID=491954 RepID=A0A3E0DM35_9GAMM|nr:DNA-processing protein DprA [Marinomonas pollencensis]REG83844.1 DNA processing protein [Marinomonas pollencensis]
MTTSIQPLGGLTHEDWLSLSFLSSIGPSRLSRLFTYFSELEAMQTEDLLSDCEAGAFPEEVNYELLRQLKWPEVTAREAMAYLHHGTLLDEQAAKKQQTLDWLAEENHHLLLQSDAQYPSMLKQISVAPAFLYVEGKLDALAYPKLGIVGARRCTGYGREVTRQLASQLAQHGISIVSGGARGIDTAAHQGALSAQASPTIAVMGTGLLVHYPVQNKALFEEILSQGGCLVSEYPLQTGVRPHLFPPRNRIISGLSLGVLVTEASLKSGSLISANYALQQNREVFALPGRVKDAQAEGCHQLIRQGAVLVRHVEDILGDILPVAQSCHQGLTTNIQQRTFKSAKKESDVSRETLLKQANKQPAQKVMDRDTSTLSLLKLDRITPLPDHISNQARGVAELLEKESQAMDFDALVRHSNLTAPAMMQVLMELELCQCIENRHGVYIRS